MATLVTIVEFGVNRLNSELKNITEIRMPSIKGLELMHEGQNAVYLHTFAALASEAGPAREKHIKAYKEEMAQIKAGRDLYEPLPQTKDEAIEWNKLVPLWKQWQSESDETLAGISTGKADEARTNLERDVRAAYDAAEEALGKVIAINYKNAADDRERAFATSRSVSVMGIIASIIVAAITIGFGTSIGKTLSKTLLSIAAQLKNGAESVASSATELSSTSVELSSAVTEQAASLQETSSSVEEMSAMVKKSADNSNLSSKIAADGDAAAKAGQAAVTRMLAAINEVNQANSEIQNAVASNNQQIGDIVKLIAEIADKTKVINDIVFQTKLLSFNASVEAARAGEHGKGFAVVAEEVGNLAQMSGNSAKEIGSMLDSSTSKVNGIVAETKAQIEALVHKGAEKVKTSIDVANECRHILDDLATKVGEMSHMANDISTASHEQSAGIGEITKAMTLLDQVTQQNSMASSNAAAASAALSKQAEILRHNTQLLLTTVEGTSVTAAQSPRAFRSMARKAGKQEKKVAPESAKATSIAPEPPKASGTNSSAPTLTESSSGAELPDANDSRFREV